MRLSRTLAGGVELSLRILLGDLHIPQSHADVFVAQQLHQSGEADAEAEHLRGEGVPQPVRRHRAGGVTGPEQPARLAAAAKAPQESLIQGVVAIATRQEEALGPGQSPGWGQSAQNQNARHALANVVIGRHEALGVRFAERDMQGPLVRSELSQTVQREIDAFTDADSSGAREQERMGRQVVGPAQLIAEKLIVPWRERSGQMLGPWGGSPRGE
jgi:hypothetical protein